LGGREGLGQIVDGLYDRIEKDHALKKFFPRPRAGERQRQKLFFEELFGGEARYSAAGYLHFGMQRRHALRVITHEGADRWLEHFRSSMASAAVASDARDQVIGMLRPAAHRLTNPGADFPDVLEAIRLASKGDLAGLRHRIERRPELLNQRGKHGVTVLWEACRRGRVEITTWLVDRGASLETPGTHSGELAVIISPYCVARASGHPDIAALLRARGAITDAFSAAYLGDLDLLASLSTADPSIVHARSPEEDFFAVTPLHHAVSGNQPEAVALLIERGAEVRPFSRRLLGEAARLESAPIVSMLLDRNADAGEAEDLGPIERADATIARMLVARGLDLNKPLRNGETFLTRACRGDKGEHPAAVEAMIALGADPDLPGEAGRSPLHVAAKAGFASVVEVLVLRGANPEAADANGETPLDLATRARRREVVDLLTTSPSRRPDSGRHR